MPERTGLAWTKYSVDMRKGGCGKGACKEQVLKVYCLYFILQQLLLSVQFSRSVVSNSLQPRGLQHARLFCLLLSSRVCLSSCPLSQWCYLTILCHSLLLPSVFPSIRVFSSELPLRIRWSKYWSFSFSSSNEYSGLISFRIDWFDFLEVQGTLKSLL